MFDHESEPTLRDSRTSQERPRFGNGGVYKFNSLASSWFTQFLPEIQSMVERISTILDRARTNALINLAAGRGCCNFQWPPRCHPPSTDNTTYALSPEAPCRMNYGVFRSRLRCKPALLRKGRGASPYRSNAEPATFEEKILWKVGEASEPKYSVGPSSRNIPQETDDVISAFLF